MTENYNGILFTTEISFVIYNFRTIIKTLNKFKEIKNVRNHKRMARL